MAEAVHHEAADRVEAFGREVGLEVVVEVADRREPGDEVTALVLLLDLGALGLVVLVRDLADAYEGSIALTRSSLGGLRAQLTLRR